MSNNLTAALAQRGLPQARAERSRFRADIQGLRAIAVGAVVLYHGSVSAVSGGYVGVDIFFVISGFLISSQLLRELNETGRLRFGAFYARRARRILPASFAVVALTLVAAAVLVSPTQLRQAAHDAIWTVLYVPNLAFAARGTDYLAQTDAPSLFQHYWSLGVEEQFYLFWPLLLLGVFALTRVSRPLIAVTLGAIGAASLWLCIVWTPTINSWAYFSLPARAWEFIVGGLIALLLRAPSRLPAVAAGVLGWLGMAGLGWSIFAFNASTQFPGGAAALPVLATAAVILAGARPATWGPQRVLALRPFTFVGETSYSIYLVHWPLLTIAAAATASTAPLPLAERVALMAASVPLGWLLYHFVENPVRHSQHLRNAGAMRSLVTAATLSVVIAAGSLGVSAYASARPQNAGRAATSLSTIGVRTAPPASRFVPSNLAPSLATAAADNPVLYKDGCHLGVPTTKPVSCFFGTNHRAPRVVLFGDSHAAEWFPALDALAQKGEIYLQAETKSSCPAADLTPLIASSTGSDVSYPQCTQWRAAVLKQLAADPPAAVVLAQLTREPKAGGGEVLPGDWESAIARTLAQLPAQTKALVVGDNPFPGHPPATCLSGHLTDASACDLQRSSATSSAAEQAEESAATAGGAAYLSTLPYLCNAKTCPVIIGNVLVYRDGTHVTATFASRMAPVFQRALKPLIALK